MAKEEEEEEENEEEGEGEEENEGRGFGEEADDDDDGAGARVAELKEGVEEGAAEAGAGSGFLNLVRRRVVVESSSSLLLLLFVCVLWFCFGFSVFVFLTAVGCPLPGRCHRLEPFSIWWQFVWPLQSWGRVWL